MGKARRCRAVVLSASVAVLGTAGACPAAKAGAETRGPRGPVAAPLTKPSSLWRRRHASEPKRKGRYVYEAVIGDTTATENEPDMTCTASGGARLAGIAFAELVGPGAFQLWARSGNAFNKTYTLTTTRTTTITVSWTPPAERREAAEESAAHNGAILNPRLQGQDDTANIGTVCAAIRPGVAIAEIGLGNAKWELPAPVSSLAALVKHAPKSITPSEYRVAFEVLPDGTVPPLAHELESVAQENGRAEAEEAASTPQ